MFLRETESEQAGESMSGGEGQREREKLTLCCRGSPRWDSILRPWDHDLS